MDCNCERNLVACICLMSENDKINNETAETVEVVEAEVISTGLDTVINEFSSWLNQSEDTDS